MCPFCYIGKRKFEMALEQFAERANVEIIWKSFQLDPSIITDPTKNVHQFLAERKGYTVEYAKQMNEHVSKMAKEVGLTYNFDTAVVANSFDAHRFSHLAKKYSLQNEAEECLFAAYFTEGKNTDDPQTLVQLGVDIGLISKDVKQMLESEDYADAVRNDIYEAHQIGVNGVPFFLFDEKYAVSGAQESSVFLQALETLKKNLVDL